MEYIPAAASAALFIWALAQRPRPRRIRGNEGTVHDKP